MPPAKRQKPHEDQKEQRTTGVHLNLKVKAQDGNEVYFKVKMTTCLVKLMDAYCARVGKEPGSVRFLYKGERIQPDATPYSLEMQDEDEIDEMAERRGC